MFLQPGAMSLTEDNYDGQNWSQVIDLKIQSAESSNPEVSKCPSSDGALIILVKYRFSFICFYSPSSALNHPPRASLLLTETTRKLYSYLTQQLSSNPTYI